MSKTHMSRNLGPALVVPKRKNEPIEALCSRIPLSELNELPIDLVTDADNLSKRIDTVLDGLNAG